MNVTELFLDGAPLRLGKRIGRGGEGEVFLASGHPKTAVKIYSDTQKKNREAKISAMVQQNLANRFSMVAFPKKIVTTRSGGFVGFTMDLIANHRPLHEAYGPKSRKLHFPDADFRFLVRAAANVARAIGQVHETGCVIGDINHSGMLIAKDATIALIDADSFQFQTTGRLFPCLVGVPDFTPPELQGKSLTNLVRAKQHDHFGLAVTIFLLLFMGRHPYSGKSKDGELSLEELIARNLFAYSRLMRNGVVPPEFVATLDDFSADIGDAFERAFGTDPSNRPAAREWIALLSRLEAGLSRCGVNDSHYYPSVCKRCPWCRMEVSIGVTLFVRTHIQTNSKSAISQADVDRIIAEIEQVAIPTLSQGALGVGSTLQPSSQSKQAKKELKGRWLFGWAIIALFLCCWVAAPRLGGICIVLIIYGGYQLSKVRKLKTVWQNRYQIAEDTFAAAKKDWEERSGVAKVQSMKLGLQNAGSEFTELSRTKAQTLERLTSGRYARQLDEYLDRFMLSSAAIPGIGHGRVATLASYGIESAADINEARILNISGFGEATAAKLLNWRKGHERKFVYNPAPTSSDAIVFANVEDDYNRKANELVFRLTAGAAELRRAAESILRQVETENIRLSELACVRNQLEVDLRSLGISMPVVIANTTKPQRATSLPGSGVKCPRCGAAMVRRRARRGRNAGGTFWGCSRYPICKGTRS